MNLQKQVEPLLIAALEASSVQRHAQRATSRLAWVLRWLRRASENHHEQSRSFRILTWGQGRVKVLQMLEYQGVVPGRRRRSAPAGAPDRSMRRRWPTAAAGLETARRQR